ncbi:MAG: dipeptide ABC transporter ATP-binding protein [Nocardioides sp.]|uniref:dipeptide ABC transporter ATP-binding protein n=1 Tax=Nocardioides sp. TaxID=35761 RepID=UPI003D6BEAAC
MTVEIPTEAGMTTPVAGLSYTLAPGEILGVVGESGSGKSMSALSLCGLGPTQAMTGGSVQLRGQELLGRSDRALRQIRGRDVGYIFQDPQAALNPLMTCGDQIAETLRAHKNTPRSQGRKRAVELFEAVGLSNPAQRARQYPHELSGGMRQRVMIAMAICCDPSVIIADEPTTALDVIIQGQVINLLRDVRDRTGAAMLFISHDLNLVGSLADRILVMHGGRVVEEGSTAQIIEAPKHPYTKALLGSSPDLLGERVQQFVGVDERIFDAMRNGDDDASSPSPEDAALRHAEALEDLLTARDHEQAGSPEQPVHPADDAEPVSYGTTYAGDGASVLKIRELSVRFGMHGKVGRKAAAVTAVDAVNLEVKKGQILGVVGESGSGKTTLARALVGLERPSEGTIVYDGVEVFPVPGRRRYTAPRSIQMVFQDPNASLNPRMRVDDLVAEGLDIRGSAKSKSERDAKVCELLNRVGIDPELRRRYPHQFSGGQRQRIAIARTLAVEPDLLVCDEAVSSLDVSIRAHVLNVLLAERARSGLSIVFIGHDLSVIRHLADYTVVMSRGQVVEHGSTEDVIFRPQHAYTKQLVAASQYRFERQGVG